MRRIPLATRASLLGMVVAALAIAYWPGGANAATTVYTCTGLTNDQASYVGSPGNSVQSSAQVLALLASTIPNFPANPALAIEITPTVPASAPAGTPYNTQFDFSAQLPASLVTGAKALGLSSVTATNATFNIGVTGGTPTNLSSFVASQTVPLVAGATISHSVTGSVTGSASTVTYQPGVVTLGLALNVNVLVTHIGTISVRCTPTPQVIASTAITGGATTTTTGPTTTTTAPTTTTTAPTTTTTAPTTTTTAPTTTTTAPTTTTTAPTTTTTTPTTTTTTPTTTTTVPKGRHHHHHHRPHHRHWFWILWLLWFR